MQNVIKSWKAKQAQLASSDKEEEAEEEAPIQPKRPRRPFRRSQGGNTSAGKRKKSQGRTKKKLFASPSPESDEEQAVPQLYGTTSARIAARVAPQYVEGSPSTDSGGSDEFMPAS